MKRFVRTMALAVVTLCLAGVSLAAPPQEGGKVGATGTINGRVASKDGAPLAGGMVYLFDTTTGPPPAHEKYWRVPDFMKPLDGNGRFSLQLPEGSYYLGAIKRGTGKAVGPPQEGDLFFTSVDGKGNALVYRVKKDAALDVGTLVGAAPFRGIGVQKDITAISGTVQNEEGKPVAGALIFAFNSAAAVGRPQFISTPTGADGNFLLRVADSGSYFLRVRSVYGGTPPVAGEILGTLGEKGPVPVTVKRGEKVQGIVIKVKEFPGRGPQVGTKRNTPPAQGVNK